MMFTLDPSQNPQDIHGSTARQLLRSEVAEWSYQTDLALLPWKAGHPSSTELLECFRCPMRTLGNRNGELGRTSQTRKPWRRGRTTCVGCLIKLHSVSVSNYHVPQDSWYAMVMTKANSNLIPSPQSSDVTNDLEGAVIVVAQNLRIARRKEAPSFRIEARRGYQSKTELGRTPSDGIGSEW